MHIDSTEAININLCIYKLALKLYDKEQSGGKNEKNHSNFINSYGDNVSFVISSD